MGKLKTKKKTKQVCDYNFFFFKHNQFPPPSFILEIKILSLVSVCLFFFFFLKNIENGLRLNRIDFGITLFVYQHDILSHEIDVVLYDALVFALVRL